MPIRPIRPHKRPIDGQASSSGGNCQKNKRPPARSPIAQQTNRYEAGAAAPTLSPHRRSHITPKQPSPPTDSACATPAVPYTGIITAPSAIIPAINTSNAARSISHVFLTAATSAADMPGSDHAIIVAGTSAANVARGRLTPEPTSAGNPTVMDANGSVTSCTAKHSIGSWAILAVFMQAGSVRHP